MKKLTAGIFATLLAVVSTGAANAEIASKGYVDQQVDSVEATVENKADSSTVTALDTRVGTAEGEIDTLQTTTGQHTSQIGTINTTLSKKLDSDTAASTYQTLANKTTSVSGDSTDTQYPSAKAVWTAVQSVDANASVEALEGRVDSLETNSATKTELATKQNKNMGSSAANSIVTTDGTGNITASATIAASKVSGLADVATTGAYGDLSGTPSLGTLASKSTITSAEITDGTIAEADLNTTIKASLDKADSALQKTTADATYAVKALEGQVGTVSKENMGTTTATTVVGGVKEAIDAAKAADTKATNATSAASAAQSAVDAVEATIGGYGDIVTHDVSEFATAAQGTKADTAVQPAAISDMLTKTEAGTTYYTKTSGDTLAGRVTTAEGEIDAIQAEMDTMATSQTVTNLTNRVTTAEGDIDVLEAAVNDAESGLAATNTIADSALSTAQSAQTTANAALPKATYDNQVGTVSATNMGTTASTVVTAIKEVKTQADKGVSDAATAQSAASAADSKAQAAQSAASAADSKAQAAQAAAEAAQETADAAIPAPDGECASGTAKCVLTFNNSVYAWEVIARNGDGE